MKSHFLATALFCSCALAANAMDSRSDDPINLIPLFGDTTFYQGVTITLNSGCTLILDGGSYEGASFDIKPGAKVKITHNAYTKLLQNGNIVIPLGAELEYTSGTIK